MKDLLISISNCSGFENAYNSIKEFAALDLRAGLQAALTLANGGITVIDGRAIVNEFRAYALLEAGINVQLGYGEFIADFRASSYKDAIKEGYPSLTHRIIIEVFKDADAKRLFVNALGSFEEIGADEIEFVAMAALNSTPVCRGKVYTLNYELAEKYSYLGFLTKVEIYDKKMKFVISPKKD